MSVLWVSERGLYCAACLNLLNHKSRKILWNNFLRVRLGDTTSTHLIKIQTGQNLKAPCVSAWGAIQKPYHILRDLNQRKLEVKVVNGKVAQLYAILCDPMDCSQPGSSVHGILRARIVKWVAIPFSRSSQPRDQSEPPGKP